MTKHRFRESIKSFFGHHVDPEKDEQLKESKIEIDDKVTKILKLIKDEENGGISIDNSKKEPLVQLIEDFHKQYENLYAQYDNLTEELRKKIHGKRQKGTSSSSSSDSDSDYSSKDGGSKHGQLGNEVQKISEGFKEELETANLEIADVKRKLTATKDTINSDYLASLSKVQNAEEIIRNLKLEYERSECEKSKLVVENGELKHELESLHSQKSELEMQFERKIQAISDCTIEIEKAKEEIASKTEDLQRVLQEKEGLLAQTNDLEFEVNSLNNQKGELKEELQTKLEENSQLWEEKMVLLGLISELEKTLAERGLEFTALQEKHNETSSQLTALLAQVNNLQQELDSLQSQRNELELQLERQKQESSERSGEMENQASKLESQINYQQRALEEQGEAYKKLEEEYKQVENLYQECKANLEVAERKVEEISEEFNRDVESKSQMAADLKQMVEDLQRDLEAKGNEKNDLINQIIDHQRMVKEQEDAYNKLSEEYNNNIGYKVQVIADLEQIVDDLKRDLEMKGDELTTLVESSSNTEVKLRLSNQKLRVTEQLLSENEESFGKAEAKLLEEQRKLEERIETLCGTITANNEFHCRMITDISGNVSTTLIGFEAVVEKFEEGYRNYMNCIEETLKELRTAKHWVEETKCEKKRLMDEVTNLIEQLKGQKEEEVVLKDRVEKLQIKANNEEGEKEKLVKVVKQLEKKVELLESVIKEKDEGIVDLGEEKREAIRQLCIWIDYHRSRCDDLKEILSKTVRVQRAM